MAHLAGHWTRDQQVTAGMLTRPAGHEAETEARKSEAEDEAKAEKIFEAEATMYEAEAEARHEY